MLQLTEDQKFIKKSRLKVGLSQEDFGAIFYKSQSSVSAWEKGLRNPEKIVIENAIKYMEEYKKEKK